MALASEGMVEGEERQGDVSRIALERAGRPITVARSEGRHRRVVGATLFLVDMLLLVGAFADHLITWWNAPRPWALAPFAGLAACCWLALYIVGGYRLRVLRRGLSLKVIWMAGCAGAMLGLVAYKLLFDAVGRNTSVVHFTVMTLLAPPLYGTWVVVTRWLARRVLLRIESRAAVLLVGSQATSQRLRQLLGAEAMPRMTAFGDEGGDGVKSFAELDAHLSGSVRVLVLATAVETLPVVAVEAIVHARLLDVPIIGPAQFVEEVLERTPVGMEDLSWVLRKDSLGQRSISYHAFKRIVDVLISLAALVLLAPVMVVVAIAVKATSKGPVFFTQVREGRWKRPFTILKFRTMRTDAERDGAVWAAKNDPRVTSIGAFLRRSRLDEVPQLINVLCGEMSLVGPRPERPEFNRMLVDRIHWYDIRHLAKPGLTGWAQVCYPYGAGIEDAAAKLEYEVYYLKNASLGFDCRILFRTVGIVLGLRGR